ncbi:MAG: EAL domain-containing protein (putative c-di-GMP-specific phosphodiesterase class I), partial [Candidatus Omnitrophota bacterium]
MAEKQHFLFYSRSVDLNDKLRELCVNSELDMKPMDDLHHLTYQAYNQMPYAIVLHMSLSNVSGFELCEQIKKDIILEHIPLIVLTSKVTNIDDFELSADLVLGSDIAPEKLLEQINTAIQSTHQDLDVSPLTQLPGSRTSVERIDQVLASENNFGMCMMRLRNTEAFYKKHGHRRGDALIRCATSTMKEFIHSRLGVDCFFGHLNESDFVLITPTVGVEDHIEDLIQEFDESIQALLIGSEENADLISISIGVIGDDSGPFKHMSELASVAEQIQVYLASYKHSVYLMDRRFGARHTENEVAQQKFNYKEQMQAKVHQLERNMGMSEMSNEILRFLKLGKVETYFQPIVDFKTQKVYAFEALSRFKKENGDYIEPLRAFEAARELNVIQEFDMLCVNSALVNAKPLPAETKIFLNLNRETLLDLSVMSPVWKQSAISVNRIVIELTEQSLVRKLKRLISSIRDLRRKGMKFALDDAGGGSVSLREAAEIKPEFIKFDRSCIDGVHKSEVKQHILASLKLFAESI